MDSRGKRFFKGVLNFLLFPFRIIYHIIVTIFEKVGLSIRLSLTFIYFKLFTGIILAFAIILFAVFSYYKLGYLPAQYFMLTKNASAIIGGNGDTLDQISREGIKFILFDDFEKILYCSDDVLQRQEPEKRIGEKNISHVGYTVIPYRAREGGVSYLFNYYADYAKEWKDVARLAKIIFILTIFSILIGFFMIVYKGKHIFHPITEMTGAARTISDENMNVRLNVGSYKNELQDLAGTFNEMMDRIEDGYNKQKQFVSDASHELKTPIAILQGYVDMLNRWGKNDPSVLDESLEALKNEAESMKDLVEKLLFLARNDKGTMNLKKESFDFSALAEETAREIRFIDKSHTISCKIQNNVFVHGDRSALKQALRIFLDNALKYTPEKGIISINVYGTDSRAVIEIADTGIGMSKGELAQIFDRFYRTDTSRKRDSGGHGLGLSIAKIIILGHSGKINVRSLPGEGTTISVNIPCFKDGQ